MNFWGASAIGYPGNSRWQQPPNGWFPQQTLVSPFGGTSGGLQVFQQLPPQQYHPRPFEATAVQPLSSGTWTGLKSRKRKRWDNGLERSRKRSRSREVNKGPPSKKGPSDVRALAPDASYEEQLSLTIWRNFVENRQSDEVYAQKQQLRRTLSSLLEPFGKDRVFVVGSSLNGFGTNKSDCDLCLHITCAENRLTNRMANIILTSIKSAFFASRLFVDIQFIPARVPILKFIDSSSRIECDLNVNNTAGVLNTRLLALYCALDWRVRPLGMFVKHWARQCDIHDASRGRLSSYAVNLLLIQYLQHGCMPPVLPCLHKDFPELFGGSGKTKRVLDMSLSCIPEVLSRWRRSSPQNCEGLAELFSGFIAFYNDMDFGMSALSVRLGRPLPLSVVLNQQPPEEIRRIRSGRSNSKIFVEEPFTMTNAARSPYEDSVFALVKRAFAKTHRFLRLKKDLSSVAPV